MNNHYVATVKIVEVTFEESKTWSRSTPTPYAANTTKSTTEERSRNVDELSNFMVKHEDLTGLTNKVQEMLKVIGGISE